MSQQKQTSNQVESPAREQWHLKREIQLGHLITTVVVAVSAMSYVTKLEQRIALLEQSAMSQHERDERQDKTASEAIVQMNQQLLRIDGKLDTVISRLLDGKR